MELRHVFVSLLYQQFDRRNPESRIRVEIFLIRFRQKPLIRPCNITEFTFYFIVILVIRSGKKCLTATNFKKDPFTSLFKNQIRIRNHRENCATGGVTGKIPRGTGTHYTEEEACNYHPDSLGK